MLVNNIERQQYDAIPGINQSRLKGLLNMTPMEWKNYSFEGSRYTINGTLAHSIALEGMSTFDNQYAIDRWPNEKELNPEGKRRSNSKAYQDYKSALISTGKIYITEEDLSNTVEVAQAFADKWGQSNLMKEGLAEASIYGHNIFGIKAKGTLDFIPRKIPLIADLKTTTKELDNRSINNLLLYEGWAFQAAFYNELYYKETGERRGFVFLVINTKSKMTRAVSLTDDSEYMEYGRNQVEEAVRIYKECMSTGVWPGYEVFKFKKIKEWEK